MNNLFNRSLCLKLLRFCNNRFKLFNWSAQSPFLSDTTIVSQLVVFVLVYRITPTVRYYGSILMPILIHRKALSLVICTACHSITSALNSLAIICIISACVIWIYTKYNLYNNKTSPHYRVLAHQMPFRTLCRAISEIRKCICPQIQMLLETIKPLVALVLRESARIRFIGLSSILLSRQQPQISQK